MKAVEKSAVFLCVVYVFWLRVVPGGWFFACGDFLIFAVIWTNSPYLLLQMVDQGVNISINRQSSRYASLWKNIDNSIANAITRRVIYKNN